MTSRLASRLADRKNERSAHLRVTNSILKSKSYDYFSDLPGNVPSSVETDENNENNMNNSTSERTVNAPSNKSGVQVYLQSSDKTYEEKLRKLRKFKNKSKKDTKQKTLKNDWLKEWEHLEQAVVNTSGDTSNSLELLVLQDPTDTCMNGILEMMNVYYEEQNRTDQEYKEKVKEMKDLLRETLRAIRCNRSTTDKKAVANGESEVVEEGEVKNEKKVQFEYNESPEAGNNAHQAFAGIFADTMLSLRSSMSSQWMSLAEEEAQLTAEVNTAKRDIFNMIHHDRLDCQNTVMSKELKQVEGDDAETLLYIEEWYKRIESMDASHSESLQLLQTKREEEATKHFLIIEENTAMNASEDKEKHLENDLLSKTSALTHAGWSEADHMTFVKVYKHQSFTMTDDAAHGNKRKIFLAQIMTHLPHRTREEILEHEAYYRSTRAISIQKKTLIQQYESSRAALLAEATTSLEKFRADRAIDKECQAQLAAQEAARMLLHQQLESLQKAKQARDEALRIEKEKMDAQQLKQQEWADKVAKAEQEFRRAQVEIFKRMKEDSEAKQREQATIAEAARTEEMKKLIALNKPKIEERERLRVLKEREKLAKEEEKQREEDRRTEMLMKLAATVPYYEDIQNAQSQLNHITAAVKAHEYGGAEEQIRGFMKNTGFDDKKIIKDARFRLAAALRDAGVAQSKIAKGVVQAFHPRPHLAIHGVLNRGAIL